MDDKNRDIGRRVGQWRMRRNLTRRQFADRVGRSVSWVDKIESGQRALLRLPMLEAVAAALDIDPRVLLDADAAQRASQCPDAVEVRALAAALGRYDAVLHLPADVDGLGGDLLSLRRRVDHVCWAWLASSYCSLGQVLPQLIVDAQNAVELCAVEPDLIEATRCLVMAYRVASSMLLKFDRTDLAWMAADRGLRAAAATDDPVSLTRASRSVARAMTRAGQPGAASDLLDGTLERLAPGPGASAEEVSRHGMLLLAAQMAAAHAGDVDRAVGRHRQAEYVALRLGHSYMDQVTAFGVTNVALHQIACLVHFHEGGRALEEASHITPAALDALPRERRATYWLDVTEAGRQTADHRRAVDALLRAEQAAPEEVRCRPVVRTLITRLWTTAPSGEQRRLRPLAGRAGVSL
jgi:transcriptional regulator with XRE-family HTH domain